MIIKVVEDKLTEYRRRRNSAHGTLTPSGWSLATEALSWFLSKQEQQQMIQYAETKTFHTRTDVVTIEKHSRSSSLFHIKSLSRGALSTSLKIKSALLRRHSGVA